MGLQINTNLPALDVQRLLAQNAAKMTRGFEGLASGLRINRARDDAAGLAIAERLQAQIRQLDTEVNNLQYGVNAAQTAEGAMGTQADALQRVRELAVQAANGTLSDADRAALNQEAQQLLQQIDQTAQNTEFNGLKLLDGSQTNVPLGTEGNMQLNLNASTTNALGVNGLDISTQAGAANALNTLDTALQRVNQNRASLGAQINRFERGIETRQNTMVNQQDSQSRIRDLDVARAFVQQTRNQILTQAGVGVLAQANMVGENALRLLGR